MLRNLYLLRNSGLRIANNLFSRRLADKADTEANFVKDISVEEFARDDTEFAREFTTSLSSLRSSESTNPVEEEGQGDSNDTAAESESISESPVVGGAACIGAIDIDGFKDFDDDEDDGVTVQKISIKELDIGDEEEYKANQALHVPDKREAQFEYKGIKIKLPERMHKDVGTYRYRRDPEDLQTVADDMRVCRFQKKE